MDQLPPSTDSPSRQAIWGCCNNLDPRKSNCSPKKIATVAAAVFALCVLALTACILIVQYPAASSAFITTFSIIGLGSFIALCIALVKHYQNARVSVQSPITID